MEPFSAWILPLLLSGASLWGARRRVDVYDALVTGGKSGLQVAVSILPALAALLTAVYMFRASGALDLLTSLLAPALPALGIQNIRLGPTLPAFLSPGVVKVLQEKYGLMAVTTPEEDLNVILGSK